MMSYEPDVGRLLRCLLEANNSRSGSSQRTRFDLSVDEIRYLCETASRLFLEESTFLQLQAPIQICGNICGQFTDLLRLLDRGGHPPVSRYLFLGGYVNRGTQSLETLCLLLVYKIIYPDRIYMLRGSHETELKASIRGLRSECEARDLCEVWPDLLNLFDCLPLAAIVNDRLFCCYGGPPKDLESFDELQRLQRPLRAPYTELGIVGDLLYSKTNLHDPGWIPQERGHLYGKDAIKSFVNRFNIKTICRAKQIVPDGYDLFSDSTELITLFSMPNYRTKYANDGAVMKLSETLTVSFQILETSAILNSTALADDEYSNSHYNQAFPYHYSQTFNQEAQQSNGNQPEQKCT